ncbi:MAG: ATP-binding protein, partial [Oscillospiraceae bacterium]|nr:ATP-binding protein [Oscillospiraceae bacterium]
MGIYLNPDNTNFQRAVNSEIYVDKTELIQHTNKVLGTEQQFICVSRPRRFGKSMAANMLTAYYSRGCNSRELFSKYKIAQVVSFEQHLNKYNVIHLNVVRYLGETKSIAEMIQFIEDDIIDEIIEEYPDFKLPRRVTLIGVLEKVFAKYQIPFVFIIDEWDCIFRENADNKEEQIIYLDFLRNLLKDQSYVALAYMTGILPIKKYGKHSALNMFTEVSMTNSREYAAFTGFTEDEVRALCEQYQMPYDETKRWYDGYQLKGVSVYNPRSVVMSMTGHDYDNYWTSTETYEALKVYIEMDFDSLRDTIVRLLAGERKKIDTTTFTNDMVTFQTQDDVLTLLVHLGYLTYDFQTKCVSIPNYEISEQFASTIKTMDWSEVIKALKASDALLEATLRCDGEKVAELIGQSHQENTSILKYNDENSLACVISLAYYAARKDYIMHRELPTGKGFADIVYIPRKKSSAPALVIELKHNQSVDTAIAQIKQKKYTEKVAEYTGDILLV